MTLIRHSPARKASGWGPTETASLKGGLDAIGLQATPTQIEQLQTYAVLLLKWNRTYNLLGATTAQALIESHLLDSLAVLPALQRWLSDDNPILLDIGSGAGLPGMALAIMLKQLPITLVEPIGKKAAFLRQAIALCKLPLARILEGRVEDLSRVEDLVSLTPSGGGRREAAAWGRPENGSQDKRHPSMTPHFICRAFASLDRFNSLCAPHLKTGSLLFAMKASRVGEELAQLRGAIEVLAVEPLRTIEREVQRNLVVMRAKPVLASSGTTRPGR